MSDCAIDTPFTFIQWKLRPTRPHTILANSSRRAAESDRLRGSGAGDAGGGGGGLRRLGLLYTEGHLIGHTRLQMSSYEVLMEDGALYSMLEWDGHARLSHASFSSRVQTHRGGVADPPPHPHPTPVGVHIKKKKKNTI